MIKSFKKNKKITPSLALKQQGPKLVPTHVLINKNIFLLFQIPKKVIKALYDYEPQGPGELKFSKGDFFHVLSEDDLNTNKEWYEATNPITNSRGMVPVSYFHAFDKKPVITTTSVASTESKVPKNLTLKETSTLHVVSLYKFKGERDDELDIEAGENLIVYAHYNYEWFIAKPIDRLGGLGLVPISYVKIINLLNSSAFKVDYHNSKTDLIEILNNFKIPTIDEWKEQTRKYKDSIIKLNTLNQLNTNLLEGNINYDVSKSQKHELSPHITEVSVNSYLLYYGRYQYLITAHFFDGKIRYLYRYYQDFYNLQVSLLDSFPNESGKIEGSKKIIPSIPGPLINLDDSVSKIRCEKLNKYLKSLIALPSHISKSDVVSNFFEVLRNGFDREFIDLNNLKTLQKFKNNQNMLLKEGLTQHSSLNLLFKKSRNSMDLTYGDFSTSKFRDSSYKNTSNDVNLTSETSLNHFSQIFDSKINKVKVKFFYEDDIFVMLVQSNLKLISLKKKLQIKLGLDNSQDVNNCKSIRVYLKNDFDNLVGENKNNFYESTDTLKQTLNEIEITDDEKFQSILNDRTKLLIQTD